MKALIIDDAAAIRLTLGHFLTSRGYEVLEAATGNQGLMLARAELPDLILLDLHLPDVDGEALLLHLVAPEIAARVLVMTAFADFDKAVRAMKNGAEYFFPKPFNLEQLVLILDRVEEQVRLKREIDKYRLMYEQSAADTTIVGISQQMIKVQRLISLLAGNPSTTALILGESGTGKELVATAIHRQSDAPGPFVEINSASLSEALLESELFGHEKGAFTDANRQKTGLFELAADGTIFLDEITEMPLAIQAKLLKVLDTRKFRRVGGTVDIATNARFIGATNRDIVALVQKGLFREDLYYRINVMPITMPPLRERGRDAVILAEHFARQLGMAMKKRPLRLSPAALELITNYRWPGNVRELKNVIERAIILTEQEEIRGDHLPLELRKGPVLPPLNSLASTALTLKQVEEQYINQILQATGNNHSRTAALLGISRSTLLVKLKKPGTAVQSPHMS
jgi:DNA-binding NtrC family response regulator